jgi:hypothetical protein
MRHRWVILAGIVCLGLASLGWSQGPQGQQKGRHGMMMDGDHAQDMELFHYLLDNKEQIRRTVTELPDGVETLTESDDPEVAAKIREHVAAMYRRIEEDRPIHRRDPLFAEIFDHADAIEMMMEKTDNGLRVVETSSDPYVAKLIKSHAEVVSQFLVNGRMEMRKNHPLPDTEEQRYKQPER